MKRIIATILLAVMVLVTSCGAEPPVLMDFLGPQTDGNDFGGVTIKINSDTNSEAEDDSGSKKGFIGTVLRYDLETTLGDAIMQRTEAVKKALNVNIEYEWEVDRETARMKLMSGSWDADITSYTGFGGMQDFAAAGMLHPIADFDIIDLNETWKYGGPNVLEGGMVNSVPYSVQPVSWPGWEPMECYALFYNRDIGSTNGITDPQEFYENQTWVCDTFESEYLAKVNITSGSEKIPCMATGVDPLYYCLTYSNNVQYVEMGADGAFRVNATPPELIEALEEGRSWLSEYADNFDLTAGYWDHDNYDDGYGYMTLASPGTIVTGSLAYEVDFFSGIMPFPCGPSVEYGRWGQAIQRIEGFGIPISSKEPEVAAHVISELFEPFDEYIGTLEEYYSSMTFEEGTYDTEIYTSLDDYSKYDYTFAGGSDLMRGVNNNLASVLRSSKGVAEAIQSYSGQITVIAEKYILPNYDYMYNNYYANLEN